jgi:signal transduction histidine kinase
MAGSLLGRMSGEGSFSLRATLLGKGGERVKVLGFWSLLSPSGPRPDRYIGLFVDIPDGDPQEPRVSVPLTAHAAPGPSIGQPGPARADPPARDQIMHTIVFHDAKNRLTALHGYASLLRESLLGSEFLPYLDKLDEIASEIERDLGVAAMVSHLGLIAPRWQNLREVIARSVSREADGRIALNDLPGSFWCLADPLFPRVFSNLFENARRHGERVTSIRITAREEEAGLLVTIEDNGVGVPAEHKELIFELGFGRHTGYGLYLAREILANAGFSIRETGDPGKGARFELRIPRGRYMVHPKETEPARIPAA